MTRLLAPTDLVNDPSLRVRPPAERVPPALRRTRAGDVFAELVRWHDGDEHARRRERVDRFVATLDPGQLRRRAEVLAAGASDPDRARVEVPLSVMAGAVGVAAAHRERAVALAHATARGMGPGATGDPAEAIESVPGLLALLPDDALLDAPNRLGLLLQTCDAVAGLIAAALARHTAGRRGTDAATLVATALREEPPVKIARRFRPDGEPVAVDLTGHPFGAGPHRCPGKGVAVALAVGTVAGLVAARAQPARSAARSTARSAARLAAIARTASRG